jgi:hypothetical protein
MCIGELWVRLGRQEYLPCVRQRGMERCASNERNHQGKIPAHTTQTMGDALKRTVANANDSVHGNDKFRESHWPNKPNSRISETDV